MCGRYYIDDDMADELAKIVSKVSEKMHGIRFQGDITPGMMAPVMRLENNQTILDASNWGFDNPVQKGLLINARAESAAEKRTFKNCLVNGRCVIPSSGFYEWDQDKNKFRFTFPNAPILYMAGLFHYQNEKSHFVILTTAANASMEKVHHRMPLVMTQDQAKNWLYESKSMDLQLHAVPPLLNRKAEMEQLRFTF